MAQGTLHAAIETAFRDQVRKDARVQSACLRVQSEKRGVDLHLAEGRAEGAPAELGQPQHLASVGKLFTATLVGLLVERGLLDFDDPIKAHLDAELMEGLHVFKGRNHSGEILVKHLLQQTSGLNDVFYPLFEKLVQDPAFEITPRGAVEWGKKHLKPVAPPGKKHHYTDTNYHLLGLIVEQLTGTPFHEAMHEHIFAPIGMDRAWLYRFSEPARGAGTPPAPLYIKGMDLRSIPNIHQIDYAGGSVVAPLDDFLIFMKALVQGRIVRPATLERMLRDDVPMGFPLMGFSYGYSIWKTKKVPLVMPESFFCWGCVGATGAFLFHHPATESYVAGTFNDFSYRAKALQFMLNKVIKPLLKG